MSQLKKRLSVTLRGIQDAANQVMIGSNEMAQSAQELAQGASNQTEAVKKLRNTIGDVAQGVEKNAEQSKETLEKMDAIIFSVSFIFANFFKFIFNHCFWIVINYFFGFFFNTHLF